METHNEACRAAVEAEDYVRMSQANEKFHRAIGTAAANEYLAKLYEELHFTSQRYANAVIFPDPFEKSWGREQYQSVVQEHAQMVEAIRARDAFSAETVAQTHIQKFRDRVIDHFRQENSGEPLIKPFDQKKRRA